LKESPNGFTPFLSASALFEFTRDPGSCERQRFRLCRQPGWIADSYSPEALKSWLDANGLQGGYAAIFSAPTRSPYQW